MENWIKAKSDNKDLVLSSRIRLARNIKNIPFPDKLTNEEAKDVIKLIENALYTSSVMKSSFNTIKLKDVSNIENEALLYKHLISKKLISNKEKSALMINEDETISLMINEEDHLRIQCITAGFNLMDAYENANNIDNLIEESLDFAFDETLGYLTSCPTNIGTGMRASVMIHLPALSMTKKMAGVSSAISQVGMTVRGLYGEGSKAESNIYQISNQITLGLSEQDILSNLTAIINQIVNEENLAKEQLLLKHKYELEDKIFRSIGILKSARILDLKESLNLISNVRMGVEMGIIKDVDKSLLNSLLIKIQPAIIKSKSKDKLTTNEMQIQRADLVRKKLK